MTHQAVNTHEETRAAFFLAELQTELTTFPAALPILRAS